MYCWKSVHLLGHIHISSVLIVLLTLIVTQCFVCSSGILANNVAAMKKGRDTPEDFLFCSTACTCLYVNCHVCHSCVLSGVLWLKAAWWQLHPSPYLLVHVYNKVNIIILLCYHRLTYEVNRALQGRPTGPRSTGPTHWTHCGPNLALHTTFLYPLTLMLHWSLSLSRAYFSLNFKSDLMLLLICEHITELPTIMHWA